MCGIAGYVRRERDDATIDLMLARIAHRGPDGHGTWHTQTPAGWHVHLGHRRLSIVDLAGGHQPMADDAGICQISFNGEIYNHQLLRETLAQQGRQFKTHSDTETLVTHLADHGAAGLADLNGMFALANWDGRTQSLLLARDRAGIKPLYYAALPCGGIAFASELTALLACTDIDRRLCQRGLASYFFRDYVQPPDTIVQGAKKLAPGQSLSWHDGEIAAAKAFWSLAGVDAAAQSLSDSDLTELLREKTDAAVAAQLMADVPLGVFLSGGIDSSLVAAVANRHVGGGLHTFSIAFDDPDYDESGYARQVAQHLGTRHTERRFSEADVLGVLDAALNCLDEPIADPSILPTYLLSRVAAEHVKVALGGDGGDELWAGYPTYKAHRAAPVYAAIPRVMRRGLFEPAVARLPVRHGYQKLEWKLKRFVGRWADDDAVRHQRWMSNASAADLKSVLGVDPDYLDALPMPPAARRDRVNHMLALDFQSYLPGSVLTKVDRASMAHGLEVRPPLLDNALIDFAFTLPSSFKLRGRRSKWLLKAIAAPLLPDAVVNRPKKGFGVPFARWMATTLDRRVRAVLSDSPLWDTGQLNRSCFATWREQHLARRADHSRTLWALVVLDRFCRSM